MMQMWVSFDDKGNTAQWSTIERHYEGRKVFCYLPVHVSEYDYKSMSYKHTGRITWLRRMMCWKEVPSGRRYFVDVDEFA